jgi:hypothetical protein
MLGTLSAASFSRLSYIALLATMALNSSVLTVKNTDTNDHNIPFDFGTHHLYSWKYTT